MKRYNILFWVFTSLLIPALGIGSVFEVMMDPDSIHILAGLGYPAYLAPLLGVARILALTAICVPGFAGIKEWAYAGLVFDVTGAIYSQLATGNPIAHSIFPAVILVVILCSYYFYHKKVQQQPQKTES